jgi:hypothetical protein
MAHQKCLNSTVDHKARARQSKKSKRIEKTTITLKKKMKKLALEGQPQKLAKKLT